MIEDDFARAYTHADNSISVATDTMAEISTPNLHFIQMNLSAFGVDNNSDVFLPDEPHGQIECTVGRG